MKALSIARESKDVWEEARQLENIGSIYQTEGNIKEALQYFEQAIKLCEKINDRRGFASLLNKIGNSHSLIGKVDAAMVYLEASLEIFQKEINDPRMMASLLNNLGAILKSKGQVEKAKNYYDQALNNYQKLDDKRGQADILVNID